MLNIAFVVNRCNINKMNQFAIEPFTYRRAAVITLMTVQPNLLQVEQWLCATKHVFVKNHVRRFENRIPKMLMLQSAFVSVYCNLLTSSWVHLNLTSQCSQWRKLIQFFGLFLKLARICYWPWASSNSLDSNCSWSSKKPRQGAVNTLYFTFFLLSEIE